MEILSAVISFFGLLAAITATLAASRFWFRPRIPLETGFLYNNEIVEKLTVSTGDRAKPIEIRFHNHSDFSISGVVLDIKFMAPTALSGTENAVQLIIDKDTGQLKTHHGRVPDGAYYLLVHYDQTIFAGGNFDTRVELNTEGTTPGRREIAVAMHTTQPEYRKKEKALTLIVQ